MDRLQTALGSVVVLFVAVAVVYRRRLIRFTNVPGPTPKSLANGVDPEFFDLRTGIEYQKSITRTHGLVARLRRGYLQNDDLFINDPVALNFILYKEPDVVDQGVVMQEATRLIHGPGVLSSTGAVHKKHRRMLSPVFNSAHVRRLIPAFYDAANDLAQSFMSRSSSKGRADVDVLAPLSEVALELVGRGVLGHSFVDDKGRLSATLKDMLPSIFEYIFWWPFLRPLRVVFGARLLRQLALCFNTTPARRLRRNIDHLTEVCESIYKDKKMFVAGNPGKAEAANDIISHLLLANERAAPEDRHSDEELIAHMAVMITAGRDTVGHNMARALQALAEHPEVQRKLRAEILEAAATSQNGEPDFARLNDMPYLEAVIRETMRLWPSIAFLNRVVQYDTVIPLARPIAGSSSLAVPAGTNIRIGLPTTNSIPELWGPDCDEFRPERWLEFKNGYDPKGVTGGLESGLMIPGVWSNMMSFIGGPRSCIGVKFAVSEMKVLLVVLLRQFELHTTQETERAEWCLGPSNTPYVRGREADGPMLPLRLKLSRAVQSV